jgi:hypothetical protein
MKSERDYAALRRELDEIVNGGKIGIADHSAVIAALASRYPHSIRQLPDLSRGPYNCFTHALGLIDSDRVQRILQRDADWYGFAGIKVGSQFMARLIADKLLVDHSAGELAVYFVDVTPRHAGRVVGERIQSKWGIGNLWDHEVWEVPGLVWRDRPPV